MPITTSQDARLYAPAAARNREPIDAVLQTHLPGGGLVLEIASGTGEHVVHFASHSGKTLTFQPTDREASASASIDAWVRELGLSNVLPAIVLDVTEASWPVSSADVILCSNMIHIAPWTAVVGLLRGAGEILRPDGKLFLYGPFRRDGRHTSSGNEAFDNSLRAENPEWGIRDLEAVADLAETHGLMLTHTEDMPANNLTLIFRRQA